MSTPARILANAANAQLSTGPRTPEGKARSAQNSLRHGLTARELIVRDDEREAFAALQSDLTVDLRPQGALEELVFNQLLHAAWNLRRLRRLEAELFHDNLDPLADPASTETLDRYARYQGRLDRAFHRAMRELRTLQTERAHRGTLEPQTARALPPLASVMELAKRTQDPAAALDFDRLLRPLRREFSRLEPSDGCPCPPAEAAAA